MSNVDILERLDDYLRAVAEMYIQSEGHIVTIAVQPGTKEDTTRIRSISTLQAQSSIEVARMFINEAQIGHFISDDGPDGAREIN